MRDDVVVAGKHERLLAGEKALRMEDEALHPREFVGIFLACHRIAIRQVDRSDAHARDDRPDIACLLIAIIARKPRPDFVERTLRQDGYSVIGLLTMKGDIVAQFLDRLTWKRLVFAFEFLQAGDIG